MIMLLTNGILVITDWITPST